MRFGKTAAVVAAVTFAGGCYLLPPRLPVLPRNQPPPPAPPTFSQYHLEGWDWGTVGRVVVLPFVNESQYTRAADEARKAFCSELQRLGLFEVVAAPPDDYGTMSAEIHRSGRFDEAVMLDLARVTRADVIVHGTVTVFSPYPRPRFGLILQGVAPKEAKVVGSVDGLWDTTDGAIAERCRTYYRQRPTPRPPWIRNNVIPRDDNFAGDLALESPALFQRFVCREAVLSLLGMPVPGILDGSPDSAPVVGKHGRLRERGVPCAPPPPPADQ